MGTTYEELIFEKADGILGQRNLLAFAPSGPSSGYLPASMSNLPLDWNAVAAAGSNGWVGRDRRVCRRTLHARHGTHAVRFYRNESCGKCVPCRLGSQKMVEMLTAGRRSFGEH